MQPVLCIGTKRVTMVVWLQNEVNGISCCYFPSAYTKHRLILLLYIMVNGEEIQ